MPQELGEISLPDEEIPCPENYYHAASGGFQDAFEGDYNG